jgi:hypothetical protein
MFFGFTLRALTKGSLQQQFYLDVRELKSTLERAKQSSEARAVARRELGELRSAISVEQAWRGLSPSRAVGAWSLAARQEAR